MRARAVCRLLAAALFLGLLVPDAAAEGPRRLRLRLGDVAHDGPLPPLPEIGRSDAGAELHLVFLATHSRPEIRAALRDAGAEVLAYLPEDVHAVRVPAHRVSALRSVDGVVRIEPFHGWLRVEPELHPWVLGEIGPPLRRLRVVAFGWGEEAKKPIAEAAEAAGATVLSRAPRGHVVEVDASPRAALRLLARDDVAWIDRVSSTGTDMDAVRRASGADWAETVESRCGAGVRGEVLDTGIEQAHQDFDDLMLHGPVDLMNHGTSTYGILFGNGDRDGDGDAKALGMLACAEQGIFADKDSVADRYAHTAELLEHPYFASFQSNSWGHTRTLDYTSYSHEMDDIVFRLDLPIFQSQSNSGDQASRPEAWAKNVISVGGIRHANTETTDDDHWSGCSSIGPAADGRIKPDLSYWADHIYTTTLGGYRPDFDGTSAAAPQAAGVLGLILEAWSDNAWGTNPIGETVFERRPHAATAKALLINSTEQYPFTGVDDDLTRMHQGWGRPSARLGLERAARSLVIDQGRSLQLDEVASYEVEVAAGEGELRATLVYPDPPGTLASSMHRINDLDLRLTSPAGTVYHGNHGLDIGTASEPGGASDALNTVENVLLIDPQEGLWQIEIIATEINEDGDLRTPEDDATFALVVTGASGTATCEAGDAPTGLLATSPEDNRVDLSWSAAVDATSYRVYRSPESCDAGFALLAETDATSLIDEPVSGGVVQHYRVRAVNACGGVSPASECSSVEPGGACSEPPLFAGLENVRDERLETCTLTLEWNAAEPRCAGAARYNVYRSTDADFLPGPGSLVASCLSTTTWSDTATDDGEVYHYVVRAEDSGAPGAGACEAGVADGNLRRRSASPSAADEVLYAEGFEGSHGWTLEGEWEAAEPQGLGGSLIGFPDPEAAAVGLRALGEDLTGLGASQGNYEKEADEAATSPVIDIAGHGELRLRYWRYLGVEEHTSDLATVEVHDGAAWVEIWRNGPLTHGDRSWGLDDFDLSAILAGEDTTRVRFRTQASFTRHYCGWNVDQLEIYEPRSCQRGAAGPPPVPDGRFAAGTPMTAAPSSSNADLTTVRWDVSSCPADEYHLFHGTEDGLSEYLYQGAACALDSSGEDEVLLPTPSSGSLVWWLVAGASGAVEGGHGYDGSGRVRSASGAGHCGIESSDRSGTCP